MALADNILFVSSMFQSICSCTFLWLNRRVTKCLTTREERMGRSYRKCESGHLRLSSFLPHAGISPHIGQDRRTYSLWPTMANNKQDVISWFGKGTVNSKILWDWKVSFRYVADAPELLVAHQQVIHCMLQMTVSSVYVNIGVMYVVLHPVETGPSSLTLCPVSAVYICITMNVPRRKFT